jgi:hypothetical protein
MCDPLCGNNHQDGFLRNNHHSPGIWFANIQALTWFPPAARGKKGQISEKDKKRTNIQEKIKKKRE